MLVTENTQYQTVEIEGTVYSVPMVFNESMFVAEALSGIISPEVLAKKCNQTLKEDLRNNWAAYVKRCLSKNLPIDQTQEAFDNYILSYEPSAMGSSRGLPKAESISRSPIEAEARRLIKEELRSSLRKKKGITVAKRGFEPVGKQISYDEFLSRVEIVLEKQPIFLEIAAANVANRKSLLLVDDETETETENS